MNKRTKKSLPVPEVTYAVEVLCFDCARFYTATAIGWDKETFRCHAAVERERDRGPQRLLTGLIVEGRQPLRDGGQVVIDGLDVGALTSGNFSPVLERGIGLGLLRGDPQVGTEATVTLRGREIAASVTALPFVR